MNNEADSQATNITEKAVILLIKRRYWSTSKSIRSSTVDVTPTELTPPIGEDTQPSTNKPDKTWIWLGKSLLSSKGMAQIWGADDKIISIVDRLCLPSPPRIGKLLPLGSIIAVDTVLSDHAIARQKMVNEWAASDDYAEAIVRAETSLGTLFNVNDYPPVESVREKMSGFTWQYVKFGAASNLEDLNRELFLREQKKVEEQWKEVGVEIQQLLRGSMAELVSSLIDKLTPTADGKPKAFRATSLNGINEFLATFECKNITSDAELKRLVEKVKQMTEGVDVSVLKSNEAVRDNLQKGFSEIKTNLEALIITGPRRKVKFAAIT